jgi:hypothetical protein
MEDLACQLARKVQSAVALPESATTPQIDPANMKNSARIRLFVLEILVAIFLASSPSQAALIAYWNFNSYAGADTPQTADSGLGTLSFAGFTGTDSANQAGATVNSRNGDPAGEALALIGSDNNGDSIVIQVGGLGLSDFVITYATRRTSTGFTTHTWAYSTDGINYTDFGSVGFTADSVFELKTVDMSSISALDNQATVFFRDTLSGATSTSGNNRFDNIAVEAVPEPTTVALGIFAFGLLAISGGRAWLHSRRRQAA